MVRIFIVDDHPHFREHLRAFLESVQEWRVCGEAENGREAVEKHFFDATSYHSDGFFYAGLVSSCEELSMKRGATKSTECAALRIWPDTLTRALLFLLLVGNFFDKVALEGATSRVLKDAV